MSTEQTVQTATERGRIASGGMGGFLNPPTHPEHTLHVQTDLQRRPENRGSMSLSAAVECAWLAPETREEAQRRIAAWQQQRPAIDSPEVKEWILQVLGYFRNCYKGHGPEPRCWHACNLRIISEGSVEDADLPPADHHAGVRHIRQYYPEYSPTAEDFAASYWGNKPTTDSINR